MLFISKSARSCALLFIGFTIGFSATTAHATPTIRETVTNPTNGHVYYLIEESGVTAADFENFAVNHLGGHLATINDAAENNFVADFLDGSSAYIGYTADTIFDGGGDPSDVDDWVWISGEAGTFTRWGTAIASPPEPRGDGPYTQFISADSPTYGWEKGDWNDVPDRSLGRAVVEAVRPDLDVDGNGEADALTDGLLIIRYLFGFSGDPLIAGAVASDCTRCTATEIEAYLAGFIL